MYDDSKTLIRAVYRTSSGPVKLWTSFRSCAMSLYSAAHLIAHMPDEHHHCHCTLQRLTGFCRKISSTLFLPHPSPREQYRRNGWIPGRYLLAPTASRLLPTHATDCPAELSLLTSSRPCSSLQKHASARRPPLRIF